MEDIRNKIVKEAETFIGTPYDKLDCSHFVQKVLKQFGYNLKPNSASQAKSVYDKGLGIMIKKSMTKSQIVKMLNPGDLIWWANPKYNYRWEEIHHIGFYRGNGQTLESTGSGDGVHVGNIWESSGTSGWQIVMICDITKLIKIQKGETDMLLKKGDKGIDVVRAQWALVALGYQEEMDLSLINENTSIGDNTVKSIKKFQKDNNISITGVIDNITFSLLLGKSVDKLNKIIEIVNKK